MRHHVGLVGAGYISEYHIEALRSLPSVTIVGIHDIDRKRAQAVADEAELQALGSLRELRDEGAEIIHVLTPPHTHAAIALEALDLGCHVMIEKPLAEDVGECEQVRAKAVQTGMQACVNHSLLFDPHVQRALAAARSGKLGRVVSVDILRGSDYPPYPGGPLPPQYRKAGYPFRDLGVHALYLFEALLGPIEDVEARWSSHGGDPNLAFDEWRALVRCRDGIGQFQLSWNVKPIQSQLIVHGTRGVLRVDLFSMFQSRRATTPLPKAAERLVNAFSDSVGPLVDMPRSVVKFARGIIKPYQGLRNLVAEFYRALEAGAPMPVSLEEATSVVRWTEHVARAADEDHERQMAQLTVADEVEVLVTGASGSVGSAIVQRLVERGTAVRCFMRRAPATTPAGVELVLGDLGDPEAVDRAVRGARTVIHAGAAMKGGWTEHECGTVQGTRNVLDACSKHGVDKLVHISSMSVIHFAGGSDGSIINEDTPLEPRAEERGAYTQAKLEAERLVLDHAEQQGLSTVVLRPGQIFGGSIPLVTGAVARRAGGRWLVLGDGEMRLPLVYMDDVVDAVLLALDGELGGGEIIQLVDPEPFTQNDVISVALDPSKVVRIPRGFVFFSGRLSEPLLGALGRQSPVSEYRLQSALAKRTFSCTNAPLLGWQPRVGVREGIQRELRAGTLGGDR